MAVTLNLKPVFCLLLISATSAVAVNFPDSVETFIFSGILILILILIVILITMLLLMLMPMLLLMLLLMLMLMLSSSSP